MNHKGTKALEAASPRVYQVFVATDEIECLDFMRREFGDGAVCVEQSPREYAPTVRRSIRPRAAGLKLSEGEVGAYRLSGAGGDQLSGEGSIELVGRLAGVQSRFALLVSP